jgi:hypothetical protein
MSRISCRCDTQIIYSDGILSRQQEQADGMGQIARGPDDPLTGSVSTQRPF